MIRRKRRRDFDRELEQARRETEQVKQEGARREPLLKRLERNLRENFIAERLVASWEHSRRHP